MWSCQATTTLGTKNRLEGILRIIQRYFFYFSTKIYIVTPHQNRLNETVPMMGHKICFYGEILAIIP